MPDYDIIIIGGGPAGLTAGIYGMRAAMKCALIEKGAFGGQMTMTDIIENYPGFEEITGFELSQKLLNHALKFGLEIIEQEVETIKTGNIHEIRLANGKTITSHSVILALGGHSRKLEIPGEKELYGKGLSYCATCDGFFFRNKTVMVIGGGDTAAEEALYLAKIVSKVYLAHRRDSLRASKILQQRVLANPKIEPLWNTVPIEIKSENDRVSKIVLQNIKDKELKEIPVHGIFVFVGYAPNSSLVPKEINLSPDGYILTDNSCLTSVQGIYAVGDVRKNYAKQIVIAASEGCIAALAASKYVEDIKAKL